jgi:hypothetical protein
MRKCQGFVFGLAVRALRAKRHAEPAFKGFVTPVHAGALRVTDCRRRGVAVAIENHNERGTTDTKISVASRNEDVQQSICTSRLTIREVVVASPELAH